jgi:hypothetical protein
MKERQELGVIETVKRRRIKQCSSGSQNLFKFSEKKRGLLVKILEENVTKNKKAVGKKRQKKKNKEFQGMVEMFINST